MSQLHPNTVLKKTEKGVIAIRDRDRSIAPRSRTLLILVDGVKTVGQLSAVGQDTAQGMEMIQQLVADGWAEALGTAPAPAPAPAGLAPTSAAVARPSASPIPTAPTARNLNLAIRAACRNLESFMGMGADPLSLQLEKCSSNKEFEAKVREIQQLLARTHSEKRASDFAAAALGG